jgi:beta-fructofuranosidase
MELGCEISCATAAQVGLKVRATPDGSEETTIVYDVAAKKLKIDMAKSTTRDDVVYGQPPFTAYGLSKAKDCKNPSFTSVEAPLELPKGEQYIQLRVFLDGPMLEVFAQDRLCMTQVIFPAAKDATLVKAFAVGGPEKINWINAWDMKPAKFENRKNER